MIKFLLLGLLASRSRYGYELRALFEELFGGTWELNPGQVYMTLQRLETDGLVTSEIVEQELRPDRRVYTLTEDGRHELKRWTHEAAEGPIRLREEMYAKVLTAMVAGEGALDIIWAQRHVHLQSLADIRTRKKDPELSPATRLVLDGAILRAEADLQWLDLCEETLEKE